MFNRRAVELLYQQNPHDMPGIPEKESLIKDLNDACDYEDLPWKIMNNGFSRLRNWHFHNTNTKAKDFRFVPFLRRIRLYYTSLYRLKDLLDSLANHDLSEKSWILRGRILHHIQDMSCPAHAVPVYHSINDSYEKNMGRFYDRGNGWPGIEERINDAMILATPLAQTGDGVKDIETIYHESAHATNRYANQHKIQSYSGGMQKPLKMSMFWIEPSGNNFFGSYGPWGEEFGNSPLQDGNGNVYTIMPDEYRQVYDDLYCKAVRETMEVLYILSKGVRFL